MSIFNHQLSVIVQSDQHWTINCSADYWYRFETLSDSACFVLHPFRRACKSNLNQTRIADYSHLQLYACTCGTPAIPHIDK